LSKLKDEATNAGVASSKTNLLKLAQGEQTKAAKAASDASKDNTAALAELSGKASDANSDVNDLADSLSNLGSGALDLSGAQTQLAQSLADATKAAQDNGATLDLNTQQGRDNQSALDGVAKSLDGVLAAQANQGATTDQLTATMEQGRQEFIQVAEQMGLTADQANALADQYGLIPSNVSTAVSVTNTGPTLAEIQRIKDAIGSIQRSVDVAVNLHGAGNLATTGGLRIAYATGGHVVGRGTGTSDSIPAWLSNGEFVVRASQTRKYRGVLDAINSGIEPSRLSQAIAKGYAEGGVVRPVQYAQVPHYVQYGGPSSWGAGPTSNVTTINNNISAPAIETQDPVVYATLMGREFARRLAG
jgi:hypothetical protein